MRSHTIHRAPLVAIAAALAAATLAACTTIGAGNGELRPGNSPVQFDWSSKDGSMSGAMSARLGTGASYTGTFVQAIQQESRLAPPAMWDDWPGVWDGWGIEISYPPSGVTTQYSGSVEASLATADGRRMQCHFTLNAPVAGMHGGGQGECRLGDGRTIDAVFHHG
ncbi:MAG: hypothetical protein JWQ76_4739 [Ramlibacter sp.]|nr:hypothetical protein [Ramlibacter sp.]